MNDLLKHVEALRKSYLCMGGMRPKSLVCPNWPWWVGTGTQYQKINGSLMSADGGRGDHVEPDAPQW